MTFKSTVKSLCLALLFANTALHSSAQVEKVRIGQHWSFKNGDTLIAAATQTLQPNWPKVNIPHTWNATDALDDERGYRSGIGWYQKLLKLKPEPSSRYIIEFEAVNHTATVYVNGQEVSTHFGGYTRFNVDITPYLKVDAEQQLIVVKADNSSMAPVAPLSADFTFWGGMYRDVYLKTLPAVHFSVTNQGTDGVHVFVDRVTNNTADAHINAEVSNDGTSPAKLLVLTSVIDASGQTVAKASTKLGVKPGQTQLTTLKLPTITKPTLWSIEQPYLYNVVTKLVSGSDTLQTVTKRTGFRYFKIDADSGFFLNGKFVKLIGVNRHQDWGTWGNALTANHHLEDMRIMKDIGINCLRISHYPQASTILEECDRLGIVAWEEISIVNQIDTTAQFKKTSANQLLDMIRQHRQHPSVVMWGFMNEVLIRGTIGVSRERNYENVKKLASYLDSLSKKEDPTRLTTMALHHNVGYDKSGISSITQVIGQNYYFGWYHDDFNGFGKKLDENKANYPKRLNVMSEFGAGHDTRIHSLKPEIFDFSAEWAQMYHESYLKQILERPFIAASMMWNLVDFGSEGRKETMPRVNNKGLVTANRKPKDTYYIYKSYLRKDPVIHIAATEINKLRFRTDEKQVIFPIKIYSNLPEVVLLHNGKALGSKKVMDRVAMFDAPLVAGTNTLIATGNREFTRTESVHSIYVELFPTNLNKAGNFGYLAQNLGTNVWVTDEHGATYWEPCGYYTPGGFGAKGGKFYRSGKRTGDQNEYAQTHVQPVYQTRMDSLEGWRADVAPGLYEVELHLALPSPSNGPTIVNDIGTATEKEKAAMRSQRIAINGKVVEQEFDIARQYGFFKPVKLAYQVEVKGREGVDVTLTPIKGNTYLNAVLLRKIR